MNTNKHMIRHKDRDLTEDIQRCYYKQGTSMYDITFHNGKTYSYNYRSIEWLRDPETPDPSLVRIRHRGKALFDIQGIYIFSGSEGRYWRVRFINGSERSYTEADLEISYSCLSEAEAQNCLAYLRQIAVLNELRSQENDVLLLRKQYEGLQFVDKSSVLATYLNPCNPKPMVYQHNDLIFPYGGNASQFEAVRNAISNQVSVIQGPPGTGKTQTILNIVANLLVRGKTVLIVSNNNSATANVLEKLAAPECGLGFLVAPLGNADNKKEFILTQTGKYPDLTGWEAGAEAERDLQERTRELASELSSVFESQKRLALARQELKALQLEKKYFEQYCGETGSIAHDISPRRRLGSGKLMRLWQDCYKFSENGRPLSFWFKLKSVLLYGIADWGFYRNSLPSIITLLQALFYDTRQQELNEEIQSLTYKLDTMNAQEKMADLVGVSAQYLRSKLFSRYGERAKRVVFSQEDLWRRPYEVLDEYPAVLSTTFSSRSSLSKEAVYDYLIMDESSQVDVATGALALSCARNAVIVGDLKQLPNVVPVDVRKRADAIFSSYKLARGYSFSDNSFLKSICSVMPSVPQTLLREHYRCHPNIIGFCNQKFYDNQLIIMTEDNQEADALMLYRTVAGDHEREGFNQRQIDVIREEVLPALQYGRGNETGIIAPYNAQVNALQKQLNSNNLDVATVHKFQGREKDNIILTLVDDVATTFSDDPYLLNVAISRAKKRLCLVVSGNEQPADSNISDLISYIEYNNFQSVQSDIYSVFDYLYQQYTAERLRFLERHRRVSQYDSENLMYATIMDVLAGHPDLPLGVICHQPLNMLIRDPKYLNDAECKYAMNTATHVDFLIYNRMSKKPIFAIEVDGFHYHKEGSKQHERDRMKDRILELYGIPLVRFSTTGSGEKERFEQMLRECIKTSRTKVPAASND